MTKLLVATNNKGKLREYRQLLGDLPLELTSPQEEGIELEVEETGGSYRENAILKATAYARASGLLTIADDSGLEVDALNGEPGIFSARYGNLPGDEERYRLLLRRLEGIPWPKRTARFRCVIALAWPGGETRTFEGVCEGVIAFEPVGKHGFGYDPVFYLPELGRTMAQLTPEEKNRISHRARAAAQLKRFLTSLALGVNGAGRPRSRL